MESVAPVPRSARRKRIPFFGLAAGSTSVIFAVAAAATDLLPHLLGMTLFLFLVAFSLRWPEQMLIVTLFVSLLVPLDLGFGQAPFRVGPTRVLLLAFILGRLLDFIMHRRRTATGELPLFGPVLLYAACGALSTAFSIDLAVAVNGFLGRDLLEQFFLFYLLVSYLGRPGFLGKLQGMVFIATLIICIFGTIEFITHSNPLIAIFPEAEGELREGIFRTRSVFFHPIALGCYLALVLPFVIAQITLTRKTLHLAGLLFLALLMVATSIFTVSRAPIACLVLELLVMAVWWGTRSLKSALLASMLLVSLVAGTVIAYENSSTFQRLFKPVVTPAKQDESSSEYYRVLLVDTVVSHLKGGRWCYGFGPNTFYLAGLEGDWDGIVHEVKSPDNHYLKILLEYGGLGLSSLLLLLLTAAFACAGAIRKVASKYKVMAVASFASACGFIAVNTTASMFHMFPLGMLFWMSVAIACTLPRESVTTSPQERI